MYAGGVGTSSGHSGAEISFGSRERGIGCTHGGATCMGCMLGGGSWRMIEIALGGGWLVSRGVVSCDCQLGNMS